MHPLRTGCWSREAVKSRFDTLGFGLRATANGPPVARRDYNESLLAALTICSHFVIIESAEEERE